MFLRQILLITGILLEFFLGQVNSVKLGHLNPLDEVKNINGVPVAFNDSTNVKSIVLNFLYQAKMEIKTKRGKANDFSIIKNISHNFGLEQAENCLMIDGKTKKGKDKIIFWILSFNNDLSAKKFIKKIEDICDQDGEDCATLQKFFVGYRRYKDEVVLFRSNFFTKQQKVKYRKLLEIVDYGCWLAAYPKERLYPWRY